MFEGIRIISCLSRICQNYLKESDGGTGRNCQSHHNHATGSSSRILCKISTKSNPVNANFSEKTHLSITKKVRRQNFNESPVRRESNESEFGIYECCGSTFKYLSHYERHLTTLKHQSIHRCHMCHEYFPSIEVKKAHEAEAHAKAGDKFECRTCHRLFYSRNTRDRHEMCSHKKKESLKWACPHCEWKFVREDQFLRHIRRKHEKRVKTFSCSYCHRPFYNDFACKTHEKNICLQGRHPCKSCSRAFKDADDLLMHEKIHIPNYKFRCMICGRGFSTFVRRESHLKTHSFHPAHKNSNKKRKKEGKGKRKIPKKALNVQVANNVSSDQKDQHASSISQHTIVEDEENSEVIAAFKDCIEEKIDERSTTGLHPDDVPSTSQHTTVKNEVNELCGTQEDCIERRIDERSTTVVDYDHLLSIAEVDYKDFEESKFILPDNTDEQSGITWKGQEDFNKLVVAGKNQLENLKIERIENSRNDNESTEKKSLSNLEQNIFCLETSSAHLLDSSSLHGNSLVREVQSENSSKKIFSDTSLQMQRENSVHEDKCGVRTVYECGVNNENYSNEPLSGSFEDSGYKNKERPLCRKTICRAPQLQSSYGKESSIKVLNERNETVSASGCVDRVPVHVRDNETRTEVRGRAKRVKSNSDMKPNDHRLKPAEPKKKRKSKRQGKSEKLRRKEELVDGGPQIYVRHMSDDDKDIFILPEFYLEEQLEISRPSDTVHIIPWSSNL